MPKIGCSLELPVSDEKRKKKRMADLIVSSMAILSVVMIFFKARK
ncbi:MAG: hypothetical protein ACYDAO_03580 [Thermoplasmataceae archaeon]